jgi:S1-C subfamily serine protease
MNIATVVFLGAFICFATSRTASANDSPARILKKNKDAVVRIYVNGTFRGCGFVVSKDGLVITAYHLVASDDNLRTPKRTGIEVEERKGEKPHLIPTDELPTPKPIDIEVEQRKGERPYQSYPASLVSSSSTTDMALLRTTAIGVSPARIETWPGDWVGRQSTMVTLLPNSDSASAASGPVSDLRIVSRGSLKATTLAPRIVAGEDCSGAPLFDDQGHVIGVVDTLARSGADLKDLQAAVDGSYARKMIAQERANEARRFESTPTILWDWADPH